MNHVFLNGKCAKEVYDHFCLRLCIPYMKCSHPRSMFMRWITNKHARPGSIFATVTLLIFWFLWNGRNNFNYNDVKMKAIRIIKRIHYMLESLLKARILIQAARKIPSPVAITWRKPKEGWFKLNTDDALKDCGQVAEGGVIRNHLGEVSWGFYDFYGTCSILEAELKAVETGLRLCWQNDFNKVWVEVDSIAGMFLCIQKDKGPWEVQYTLESIHQNVTKWKSNFLIYGGKVTKLLTGLPINDTMKNVSKCYKELSYKVLLEVSYVWTK
ncbi:RNase H domain-containing protein [Abeliophyllum distichum]|uniref:RNase H domain-containing protein n=1 Tax=Abeliophyllum distichum TaxID=126358 RepID=A0ABD1QTR9_9LAMI